MGSEHCLKGLTEHFDQVFEMGGGFFNLALVTQGAHCSLVSDFFEHGSILPDIGYPSRQ